MSSTASMTRTEEVYTGAYMEALLVEASVVVATVWLLVEYTVEGLVVRLCIRAGQRF